MRTNRMYTQEYKCPKCDEIQGHIIWESDKETSEHECIKCSEKITSNDTYKKERVEVPIIKTPTKHRY